MIMTHLILFLFIVNTHIYAHILIDVDNIILIYLKNKNYRK